MTNKFFVIGKGTAHSPSKLKAHYGDSLQVIGDGKSSVDIADIVTHKSGDRFILNPHGCPDGVSFDQANIETVET